MEARRFLLHHQTVLRLQRLKQEAEHTGAYRVAKRIHAVLLNACGRTSGEIAQILDSARSCVCEWLKNYEIYGDEGLLEGQRSGRPAELSESALQVLADIVESGPVAYGFISGVWTSVMIARVIEEEFAVSYHPGHVRKILHALDFSLQRPRKQLAKADPLAQNKWRRYTYPNIKKKPKPLVPG